MFDDLEFVQPGLTVLPDWWPDGPAAGELLDVRRLLIGGLGRKPWPAPHLKLPPRLPAQ